MPLQKHLGSLWKRKPNILQHYLIALEIDRGEDDIHLHAVMIDFDFDDILARCPSIIKTGHTRHLLMIPIVFSRRVCASKIDFETIVCYFLIASLFPILKALFLYFVIYFVCLESIEHLS